MAATASSSSASTSAVSPFLARAPPAGTKRRTALVTGSSSGIGVGIARQLASQGFDIGLTRMPRDAAEASEAYAAQLSSDYGITARVFVTDFTSPATACPQLMQDFLASFGRIDVLVNNAAFSAFNGKYVKDMGSSAQNGAEEIARNIHAGYDVNFVAPFLLSWAAVRQFLQQDAPDGTSGDPASAPPPQPQHPDLERLFYTSAWGRGRIINITSVHACTPLPKSTIYVTTKHALLGLTRNLAAEVARDHITVNAVGPGMIATPMTSVQPEDVGKPEHYKPTIPVGRPGMPSEVAGAVGYLCSMTSRYTTGQSLYTDGGFLQSNPQYLGIGDGLND